MDGNGIIESDQTLLHYNYGVSIKRGSYCTTNIQYQEAMEKSIGTLFSPWAPDSTYVSKLLTKCQSELR